MARFHSGSQSIRSSIGSISRTTSSLAPSIVSLHCFESCMSCTFGFPRSHILLGRIPSCIHASMHPPTKWLTRGTRQQYRQQLVDRNDRVRVGHVSEHQAAWYPRLERQSAQWHHSSIVRQAQLAQSARSQQQPPAKPVSCVLAQNSLA